MKPTFETMKGGKDSNDDQITDTPPAERFAVPPAIDIKWRDDANDNYFTSKNFQGAPGVHASVEQIDPLYLFYHELIDLILTHTNLYAQQYIDAHELCHRSRAIKFKPITKDEIMLYFAMILYRGIVWKPT